MRKKMTNEDHYDKFIDLMKYDELIYEPDVNYSNWRNRLYGTRDAMRAAIRTHKAKTASDMLNIIKNVKAFGAAVTLDKLIYCYGNVEGTKQFKKYCDRQAYTASSEYFLNEKGMTQKEVNEFNASRAVTLENMIARYGDAEGEKRFKKYCDRQAYTNTKAYLGDRYEIVNSQKAHTIENYIRLYGEDNARSKLEQYYSNTSKFNGRSKKATVFFDDIKKEFPFNQYKTYYGDKEYVVVSKTQNRVYLYDFVCYPLKMAVEFHGDHYHGNPVMYRPENFLKGRGQAHRMAKDVWKYDATKKRVILEERGIELLTIWESEHDINREAMIRRVIEYGIERVKLYQ